MKYFLPCAVLAAGACLPSCDDVKDKGTTPERRSPSRPAHTSGQSPRENPLAEKAIRKLRESDIANENQISPTALEEAFQSASQIILAKKLTPESPGAESLETSLTVMLRNGDTRIYDLISQLPPGNYSESIVKKAFMRADFADLKSVFDACAPIKAKDLHRAAINGAAPAVMTQARMGGPAVNVTRSDVEQLRAAGLDLQHLSSMMVLGVVAGNLGTSDIVAEINDRDNSTLITALSQLPPAKAKEVFIEALKQGKPVDPGSASQLALNLFHENPTEAVSWFSQFPPETAARGTRGVVKEWMAADPLAASAFVGGMATGPPKDAAMTVIVTDCLLNGDQETAAKWAGQISDDGLREKTQTKVREREKR